MALPPDAAEQVRALKTLERAILAEADRAAGGSGTAGTARDPAPSADAAARTRAGSLARLDRELREL